MSVYSASKQKGYRNHEERFAVYMQKVILAARIYSQWTKSRVVFAGEISWEYTHRAIEAVRDETYHRLIPNNIIISLYFEDNIFRNTGIIGDFLAYYLCIIGISKDNN